MKSLQLSQVFEGIGSATRAVVARVVHMETSIVTDIILYLSIFLFISLIIWLSNREIKKSLERARASEKLLESERNDLEQRVSERAKELVSVEKERFHELERAAQFGTLSRGLFHDLISSLSSISLYIEQLNHDQTYEKVSRSAVDEMIGVSKRMNSFMENLKRYIGKENKSRTSETVDVVKEVMIVRDILAYKARTAGVVLEFDMPASLVINAHHIRIHQIILNLMSNAIEACESSRKMSGTDAELVVSVSLMYTSDSLVLSVADTGSGIPVDIMPRLFNKPFTTKKEGTGSGLITIRSIVEQELRGTVSVENIQDTGARFIVTIPNGSNHI